MNLLLEVSKELAGKLFDDMASSREACLAYLDNADGNIRIAALSTYGRRWPGSCDAGFVDACRRLAAADPDENVRIHAIDALGECFGGTRDSGVSSFLANTAKDATYLDGVRHAAYWALKQVQSGLTPEVVIARATLLAKRLAARAASSGEADEATDLSSRIMALSSACGEAAAIDWSFVDRHAEAE